MQFPLHFKFKITTLANDFTVQDNNGNTVAYVRQKMFKFVDEIMVYSNESKSELLYTIKANKWIDFNAAYAFTNSEGNELGKVARRGWASIWKARYEIYNEANENNLIIQEENPWVKVGDALLSEIPILGLLTGYLFNPAYVVKDQNDQVIYRLKKEASFFGRKFSLQRLSDQSETTDLQATLSLMMMILLERRRG
ncbi:MAG: hypothetical protein RIR06_857 [Bacteroidota bacterium]|jgi:uncharacterized protein YxjI